MTGTQGSRGVRVAERIRAELMEMLLRGAVHDPAVASAYVTRVTLTDDLRQARVYFRLTQPAASDKERGAVAKALGRASGFLRRELGARVRLKYMPELEFFWDDGPDRAARVDALLQELRDERERGGGDDA